MKFEPKDAGRISALAVSGLALLAGLVFLAVTLIGDYTWVARIGGTLWVLGLMAIVLLPTVMPFVRSRLERR